MGGWDLRGLHLHFDAPSGAAGDMALGALLDLGVPESAVREVLDGLGVGGYQLSVTKTTRGGLAGTDVRVIVPEPVPAPSPVPQPLPVPSPAPVPDPEEAGQGHGQGQGHGHGHEAGHERHWHDHHAHAQGHPHRRYRDIRALVSNRTLGRVRELALSIFDKVATAEAKLHAVAVDDVMFHEVGAIDSIVDVVGAAAAIAWLSPASVSGSPPATGGGTVGVAHGRLPVPAPATLEICRAAGVPTAPGGIDRELLTPTGAAILATVVETWSALPAMTTVAVGYGAGDMELADRPNLLRAVVGRRAAAAVSSSAELVELHANLDDMSPELCDWAAERIFAAGALDVWWSPAVMKKSRPAFVLGVLAPGERADQIARVILEETTTLGVRRHPVSRDAIARRSVVVDTEYGPVSVKLGVEGERVINVAPEHDSCLAVARARGVPLKEVYAAAVAASRDRHD